MSIEGEHCLAPMKIIESGLAKTVRWYLEHIDWIRAAADAV
jgi:dTDP-D-glucose 4,6-dehydratase